MTPISLVLGVQFDPESVVALLRSFAAPALPSEVASMIVGWEEELSRVRQEVA